MQYTLFAVAVAALTHSATAYLPPACVNRGSQISGVAPGVATPNPFGVFHTESSKEAKTIRKCYVACCAREDCGESPTLGTTALSPSSALAVTLHSQLLPLPRFRAAAWNMNSIAGCDLYHKSGQYMTAHVADFDFHAGAGFKEGCCKPAACGHGGVCFPLGRSPGEKNSTRPLTCGHGGKCNNEPKLTCGHGGPCHTKNA